MLHKLLRKRPISAPATTVPPGQRVYAVGDIHGRLDLLDTLLARIDADDADRGQS
jgi:serine/threonine protein phosphatase 1